MVVRCSETRRDPQAQPLANTHCINLTSSLLKHVDGFIKSQGRRKISGRPYFVRVN